MTRLAFVFGITILGAAAATPARADFTVIRFGDGYCQIWSDSTATPWGVGWTRIAITADWISARAVLDTAIANRTCN